MSATCWSLLALVATVLSFATAAHEVTPVQKVITLLEDLETEVKGEGAAEAKAYDEFACFCKQTTDTKSKSIIKQSDDIDADSAQIEQQTATKNSKAEEYSDRQVKQEKLSADLADSKAHCQKELEEYEANNADLTKAISSLDQALTSLTKSKPTSFLALRGSLEKTLAVADALKLLPASKQNAFTSLLQEQVDPNDPTYKYHSEGIISTLGTLFKDFKEEKKNADDEETKRVKACKGTQDSLDDEMKANKIAMGTLETNIEELKGKIATTREALVNGESVLKDDQQYMKELTHRCETRAQDWDQRSELRKNELEALAEALGILKNKVKDLDTSANARVLLSKSQKPIARHAAGVESKSNKAPSFLQGSLVSAATMQEKQTRAVDVLQEAGHRLHSTAISALASHIMADPFEKVKTLIQKLIERLLAEATAEVSKKSFCDEELGKAKQDRKHRLQDTKKLNSEISTLEAKQDALEEEIKQLKGDIQGLSDSLDEVTKSRNETKTVNMKTIKDAKEGLGAITEALTILKVFYKNAGKAKVFLQASPVDEDTGGAGFSGAYSGKQEASNGIIGMLEVIKTDFERTLRITTEQEKQDHKDFVEFDRVSRADISGKETKQQLDEEDLDTTKTSLDSKMDDLQTAQDLLDKSLQVIEGLKPTCIDTGMSYADRVAKREEEVQALKKALCILDPEGVEADCA